MKISRIIVLVILLAIGGYIYWTFLRPVPISDKLNKDSMHYINDLYYSEGLYRDTMLDEYGKKMYDKLLQDIKDLKADTKLEGGPYNCDVFGDSCKKLLEEVLDAMILDHPELTQWGTYTPIQVGEYLRVDYVYAIGAKLGKDFSNMKSLRMLYDKTKVVKDGTDIEKVKHVYEYLSGKDKIAWTFQTKETSYYNIFSKGKATSDGFAKAAQLMFQYLGIESYLVLGEYNGHHMWNIVKIDGAYYYFDATLGVDVEKDAANYYQGIGPAASMYKVKYENLYPSLNGTEHLFVQ